MSINRELIRRQFKNYTDQYGAQDEQIQLKVYHTRKVAEITDEITKSLGMTGDDRDLAWAIAMLHDIGRFEQVKRYHTFQDAKSVDHARFGANLLFMDGLIESFGADMMSAEERKIIEVSIRQHNRYRIDEQVPDRAREFCQIIRDADKADIFRVIMESPVHVIYGVSEAEMRDSTITRDVMANFRELHCIPRPVRRTPADMLAGHIAMAFELVYPRTREMVLSQGHIFRMLDFRMSDPDARAYFSEMKRIMVEFFDKQEGNYD